MAPVMGEMTEKMKLAVWAELVAKAFLVSCSSLSCFLGSSLRSPPLLLRSLYLRGREPNLIQSRFSLDAVSSHVSREALTVFYGE